jgi:hypothetical protein
VKNLVNDLDLPVIWNEQALLLTPVEAWRRAITAEANSGG